MACGLISDAVTCPAVPSNFFRMQEAQPCPAPNSSVVLARVNRSRCRSTASRKTGASVSLLTRFSTESDSGDSCNEFRQASISSRSLAASSTIASPSAGIACASQCSPLPRRFRRHSLATQGVPLFRSLRFASWPDPGTPRASPDSDGPGSRSSSRQVDRPSTSPILNDFQ